MLQVYAKIFERDNMRLLLKPVVMGETRDFASSNVDSFVKRGLRLAPNVDLTRDCGGGAAEQRDAELAVDVSVLLRLVLVMKLRWGVCLENGVYG